VTPFFFLNFLSLIFVAISPALLVFDVNPIYKIYHVDVPLNLVRSNHFFHREAEHFHNVYNI
jgi:hypothetical protein